MTDTVHVYCRQSNTHIGRVKQKVAKLRQALLLDASKGIQSTATSMNNEVFRLPYIKYNFIYYIWCYGFDDQTRT